MNTARVKINKQELFAVLTKRTQQELELARQSAQETYEAATNEESKPENEYDTRALEASYLAMAQSKRISELEELLTIYHFADVKSYTANDPVGPAALIQVLQNGKNTFLLMMPKGGGQSVQFQGQTIQIITANSPVGEALWGLKVGEDAVVDVGSATREIEIIDIQ